MTAKNSRVAQKDSKSSNETASNKDIDRALQNAREKLLDLSLRNKLLKFTDNNRSVRVCDEIPDEIYRLLVQNQIVMEFLPDPEKTAAEEKGEKPGQPKNADKDSAEEASNDWMDEEEEDFLLPLPPQSDSPLEDKYTDQYLQTPLGAKHLQTKLLHIYYDANTVIQETGTNMLYLAVGFLQWSEEKFNKTSVASAPLILIPVKLERGNVKTRFSLSWTSEDIETNESLLVKLRELGVELPRLDDTEDIRPERYFDEVTKAIAEKKDWKIKREMVLGFFHFGKLRMYLDLDPSVWGGSAYFEGHGVLGKLFGAEPMEDLSFEDSEADKLFDSEAAPLIMDADSSQHSVILEALSGRSMVIEGPPGTGKSQTISNLIAGFLKQGKTILFVAEKAAALDVVKDRLRDAGLGQYCLELHSHKANKQSVLQSLKQRLDSRSLGKPNLYSAFSELRSYKKQLSDYVLTVNEAIGESGYTVNQAIGIHSKITMEQPELRRNVPRTDDASSISKDAFRIRKRKLENCVQLLKQFSPLNEHALFGFEPTTYMPGDETLLRNQINQLITKTKELEQQCDRLPVKISDAQLKVRDMQSLLDTTDKQKILPSSFPSDAVSALSLSTAMDGLIGAKDEARKISAEIASLEQWFQFENLPDDTAGVNALIEPLLADFPHLMLDSFAEVCTYLDELSSIYQSLVEIVADGLLNNLIVSGMDDDRIIEGTLITARLGANLPKDIHPLLIVSVRSDSGEARLRSLKEIKRQYDELFTELDTEIFVEDLSLEHSDLLTLADSLETLSANFLVSLKLGIFSSNYRKAIARIKAIRRDDSKSIEMIRWSRLIRKLDRLLKLEQEISSEFAGDENLNGLYSGIKNTNWEHFDDALDWVQRLRNETLLPGSFIEALQGERVHEYIGRCGGLEREIKKHQVRSQEILGELKRLNGGCAIASLTEAHSFSQKYETASQLREFLSSLLVASKAFCVDAGPPGTISEWPVSLDMAIHARRKKEVFEARADLQKLGVRFEGLDTNFDFLIQCADWLAEAQKIPSTVRTWIMQDELSERWNVLLDWCQKTKSTCREWEDVYNKFADASCLSEQKFFHGSLLDSGFSAIIERLDRSLYGLEELGEWCHAHSALKEITDEGLLDFVSESISDPSLIPLALPRYELSFSESLLRIAHQKYPQIRNFRRLDHEQIRAKFQKLDAEVVQQCRRLVAAAAHNRAVPAGIYGARVAELSDLHLIKHEIGKEKRHRPLRELLERAGGAMLGLKPVFMMSPMSVAQYLKPKQLQFDVLIMDEASQIRPECAFGAMARARQVIVVGDTKQLPPTDFFQTDKNAEETDDTSTFEQLDSILEYSSKVFPSKILKWHYRSRHESLIAFSNAEYYDYSLLYVPSPTDTEELGINWRYVEGVYDRGKSRKNRIEAREVAQSIIEHARKHSNLSLGIGTLNRPQAEAIEEELEILRASNQDTEPFFTKKVFRGQVEEPFFIKNLENIQGDERDVIMISIGFGKDRDGILYQNFGPLQNDGGWRRLNVLVTRARQRIELFSSMRADEIEISPGRNMSGSAALKRYLAFAESKILDQPKETGREPDSPFEEAVIRLLHREGFQVTPQLGVRGFYIDIAVHHPKMPGKYILAVECDGATYHSLRSTRDRDRLREAALVSQGWRVHRIWSTSWFANPEEERKRLLHAISESVK